MQRKDGERLNSYMPGSSQRRKKSVISRAGAWAIIFLAAQTVTFGFNFNMPLVSLTNHDTSAYSNYTALNFPANFAPTSWVSQYEPSGGASMVPEFEPGRVEELEPTHAGFGFVAGRHFLSRRALPMTIRSENPIAAAHRMGLIKPSAASGTPMAL